MCLCLSVSSKNTNKTASHIFDTIKNADDLYSCEKLCFTWRHTSNKKNKKQQQQKEKKNKNVIHVSMSNSVKLICWKSDFFIGSFRIISKRKEVNADYMEWRHMPPFLQMELSLAKACLIWCSISHMMFSVYNIDSVKNNLVEQMAFNEFLADHTLITLFQTYFGSCGFF